MISSVIPKHFSCRTALLVWLPAVSYFSEKFCLPTSTWILPLGPEQNSSKGLTHRNGVGPDPFSLTLAVHVSFLLPEGTVWTVPWTDWVAHSTGVREA